jgi:bifunctional enzyme CysN/CysC
VIETAKQSAAPDRTEPFEEQREQMQLVVVGHVDHGKSTLIGRLMADLGGLPESRIEQIRSYCASNSRPFEFAFLLDALKNEQSQGITIETARCFCRTARRDYVINDAPGHIEFLKNMVTGASRAEAALLVIDAHEGVRENSRRHGYLVSMLGIRQVAVVLNKMDLADFSQARFEAIRSEYQTFLARLGVHPLAFIPVSARAGINVVTRSPLTGWYEGPTVSEQLDAFCKNRFDHSLPFRMPVQDVYKFTQNGDDRRIIAGSIETGSVGVGDKVVFYPSGKTSSIRSIEGFNAAPCTRQTAGRSVGFTLDPQVYLTAGEIMARAGEPEPSVATRFRANLFWLGRSPMLPGRRYKLKVGSARAPVELVRVTSVVDAGDLSSVAGKQQVDRHDVAECILETAKPLAFDCLADLEKTSRFVIIDAYDIAGCGTILERLEGSSSLLREQVNQRERTWQKGLISFEDRAARNAHTGRFVVLAGIRDSGMRNVASRLEKRLFSAGCQTYFLSIENLFDDWAGPEPKEPLTREAHLERLGELAHLMTDCGLLFITALEGLEDHEVERLRILTQPHELFLITVGPTRLVQALPQVALEPGSDVPQTVEMIFERLSNSGMLPEYCI